jgi:hypothetical protein
MPGPTARGASIPVAPKAQLTSSALFQRKSSKTEKSHTELPPKVFRLETGPILCFQPLTGDFN